MIGYDHWEKQICDAKIHHDKRTEHYAIVNPNIRQWTNHLVQVSLIKETSYA